MRLSQGEKIILNYYSRRDEKDVKVCIHIQ